MSDIQVYIKMPSYLRQWFIHRHGGEEPVVLRQGSMESKIIKLAQSKPPVGYYPTLKQADEVAVCIAFLIPSHATLATTTISRLRARRR